MSDERSEALAAIVNADYPICCALVEVPSYFLAADYEAISAACLKKFSRFIIVRTDTPRLTITVAPNEDRWTEAVTRIMKAANEGRL